MERTYNFTIGQKVKMRDPDDGDIYYGEVIDKTSITVIIKWNHLFYPREYEQSAYEYIKPI